MAEAVGWQYVTELMAGRWSHLWGDAMLWRAAKRVFIAAVLFVLLVLILLKFGVIDVAESVTNVPFAVVVGCEEKTGEIYYWKATSRDNLAAILAGRQREQGCLYTSGDSLSIAAIRPTTFDRIYRVGERLLILELHCKDAAVWRTVVEIDDRLLRQGSVALSCPCDGDPSADPWIMLRDGM